MKTLLLLLCILYGSACTTQKKTPGQSTDETGKILNPALPALPICIRQLIAKYQQAPKENPPRKIFSYLFKGKTVYYVTPPCCDMYSELFDSECKLLGHPDGGITGKGDGTLPDFRTTKTQEEIVWEDKR